MAAERKTQAELEQRYVTDATFHAAVHHLVQLLTMLNYEDLEDATTVAVRIIEEKARRVAAGTEPAIPKPSGRDEVEDQYRHYLANWQVDDPRR